jgi:hypothetical protein
MTTTSGTKAARCVAWITVEADFAARGVARSAARPQAPEADSAVPVPRSLLSSLRKWAGVVKKQTNQAVARRVAGIGGRSSWDRWIPPSVYL